MNRYLATVLCTVMLCSTSALAMGDPSYANCEDRGGYVVNATTEQGSMAICALPDGRYVEAWHLLRSESAAPTGADSSSWAPPPPPMVGKDPQTWGPQPPAPIPGANPGTWSPEPYVPPTGG